MQHLEACGLLSSEIELFASRLADVPADAPVPSCPEWTVDALSTHLGTVHRWAERLVQLRAALRIPAAEMDLDLAGAGANPGWIRGGGESLVATLRAADPDAPMWAWGADQHVRFWSRRQLHETLVHRFDLELAGGIEPDASPALASDGIDELLVNLRTAAYFSPNVAELRGDGATLAIRADDAGAGWTVTLSGDGFSVVSGAGGSETASLSGPALAVLLVLYRRRPVTDAVSIAGDRRLVEFWLEHSALR